ncbi:hypothetical protein B0H13DRAFT_1852517 [Mycena leptocephala]|nr:hypothetical protein B0H13DRAFT_1852517 [Mycena leptocephala]
MASVFRGSTGGDPTPSSPSVSVGPGAVSAPSSTPHMQGIDVVAWAGYTRCRIPYVCGVFEMSAHIRNKTNPLRNEPRRTKIGKEYCRDNGGVWVRIFPYSAVLNSGGRRKSSRKVPTQVSEPTTIKKGPVKRRQLGYVYSDEEEDVFDDADFVRRQSRHPIRTATTGHPIVPEIAFRAVRHAIEPEFLDIMDNTGVREKSQPLDPLQMLATVPLAITHAFLQQPIDSLPPRYRGLPFSLSAGTFVPCCGFSTFWWLGFLDIFFNTVFAQPAIE